MFTPADDSPKKKKEKEKEKMTAAELVEAGVELLMQTPNTKEVSSSASSGDPAIMASSTPVNEKERATQCVLGTCSSINTTVMC